MTHSSIDQSIILIFSEILHAEHEDTNPNLNVDTHGRNYLDLDDDNNSEEVNPNVNPQCGNDLDLDDDNDSEEFDPKLRVFAYLELICS